MSEKKIMVVCDDCGYSGVSADSVSGYWNVSQQEWNYDHYDDRVYCAACGDGGSDRSVTYDPDRFELDPRDYDEGDVVKFQPDLLPYNCLYGNEKLPDDLTLVLAVVVDDEKSRSKSYDDMRETIVVRLMTGEAIEVWPRDIFKVEA